MSENEKVSAVLLAGGKGQRFHGEKQFAMLGGKPMWKWVYETTCSAVGAENITVVGIDVPGGVTRTHSVINGLRAVDPCTRRVLIVEAARPLVTVEQLKLLAENKNPSVTFVRPCVNTPIYRDGRYINRNELYDILTPQAFDYRLIKEALDSGKYQDETDETRIMYQHFGILPTFIETTDNLLKVTYPQDIYVVESILKKGVEVS